MELFQLDKVKLWRFLVLVQEDYHSDNPYHNAVHAADVTQAMYCFLQEPMVRCGDRKSLQHSRSAQSVSLNLVGFFFFALGAAVEVSDLL